MPDKRCVYQALPQRLPGPLISKGRHLRSRAMYTRLMQMADLSADDPLKFYLRELATVQPLASDEGAELLRQMRIGDERAEII